MNQFLKVAKLFTYFVLVLVIIGVMITFLVKNMTANEILESVIISILSGILGSFIFIFLLLSFLRPAFSISPYICFRNGKYVFKILNRSIYHAYDARIELYLMIPYNHTGANSNVRIVPLTVGYSNMTNINRYRSRYHKKDPFALFALTVFTEFDLRKELTKEGTFLEFKLTVKHGLTGLADTFIQHFPNETIIKDAHKFCFGKNLSTIPENQSV